MITQREIYLDSNATHALLPSVKERLALALIQDDAALGNPSSIHRRGQKAKASVASFRDLLCQVLGRPDGDEFVFLSGATEALNLALRGFVAERKAFGRRPLLLATAVEHKAVLDTCASLQSQGFDFAEIPVDSLGALDEVRLMQTLDDAFLDPKVDVLFCSQVVNNETGVAFALPEILGRLFERFAPKPQTRLPKIKGGKYPMAPQRLFVCLDAAQAFCKMPETWLRQCLHYADAAALSGHKIGAAPGVGLLWSRAQFPMAAQITGGTQERRRRAGTPNTLGLLSFRYAIEDWVEHGETYRQGWETLRRELARSLLDIPGLQIHGHVPLGNNRPAGLPALANTLNFHVEGCPEESLLLALDLDGFCVSSGSACNSGSLKPSHVLLAMGYSEEVALSSVRVSFGTESSTADLAHFAQAVHSKVAQIRRARLASSEIFGDSRSSETTESREL